MHAKKIKNYEVDNSQPDIGPMLFHKNKRKISHSCLIVKENDLYNSVTCDPLHMLLISIYSVIDIAEISVNSL